MREFALWLLWLLIVALPAAGSEPHCHAHPNAVCEETDRQGEPMDREQARIELDQMKQQDLRLYAASLGYIIDPKQSSRGSTVMRCGHDKIIVSLKPDSHYTYWSPRDDTDHGSIIDFCQKRKGLTLGQARKELRAFFGAPAPEPAILPTLSSSTKDLALVRKRFEGMRVARRHPYLENERGIPAVTLQHSRFLGTIRIDSHGAAVFPHRDASGEICGYELKNRGGFVGFAQHGRKSIWMSNTSSGDRRLVIAEAAIDALSQSVLVADPQARYCSIGGKPTSAQHEAMRVAMRAMPAGSEIVAATDADDAGDELANLIERLTAECPGVTYRRDRPVGAKDFNDVLRKNIRAVATARRMEEPHPG